MPEPRPWISRPSPHLVLGCSLAIGILVTSSTLLWSFALIHSQYTLSKSAPIAIETGMTPGQVLRLLHQHRLIHHPQLLHLYLRVTGKGKAIQAGEYRFESPTSEYLVLRKLWRGEVLLHAITIPEGLTVEETAERLAQQGFGTYESFQKEFLRTDLLQGITSEARTLEGYLAPDTYRLPRGISTEEIIQLMVRRFQELLSPTVVQKAEHQGLTLHQAVTLASLIEKETARANERPVIASVFHNRLARHMLLQCDPTVIFALKQSGQFQGKLTKADLNYNSLYNTYRYPGLPPGPICSPGRASIEAAVDPALTSFIYFVARPDGSHQFSVTLAEHNRAVHQYQILPMR